MQAAEIMGGTGDNMFSPLGDYTREASIVTILRLFDIGITVTPQEDWETRTNDSGGRIDEGRFDRNTGRLINGTAALPGGPIGQSKFDRNIGNLIEGTIIFPDGEIWAGTYDIETGALLKAQ